MKRYILTALAYIIPTMIWGLVWHLVWFKDQYHALGIYNREEPIIPMGFSSMILQGMIIAHLYPYYTKGNNSFATVMRYNLLIGALFYSITTIANAAKIHITSMQDWMLLQTAFTLLQFVITGLVMWVVNKKIVSH